MKSPILYLAILIHLPFCANSQNWQWANKVGSNILQSYDYARVITDGSNSYLAGRYSGSLFLQTDTLISNGTNDLFVIKYDSNGDEVWAKGFGGNSNVSQNHETIYSCYDSVNNFIYLTGSFIGTMYLDSVDTLNAYNGFSNIFLAKMDLNGNFIWGKSFTNTLADDVSYIYQFSDGDILLAGEVGDTTYFDSFKVAPGGFFARFDTNGNCEWAKHQYSTMNNSMPAIEFIGNEILLAGSFTTSFSIDTVSLISNNNSRDGYLAKLDSSGKVKWVKTYGYSGNDAISIVEKDGFNNIYIYGSFQDSLSIDNATVYSQGQDAFFAKLDSMGNLLWLRQFNVSNGNVSSGDVEVEDDGTFYILGTLTGSVTFGQFSISAGNVSDAYLARFESNGNCIDVVNFGYASGYSLVLDNNGKPICVGGFQNTITLGNNVLTSNGWFDIYIAKSDVFTGIVEGRITNNELLIYANPNQGKCNITIPDEFANENHLVLRVFDQSGKLIQEQKLQRSDGKIRLNLEAEAKGTYHVTMSNQKKSYHGKLILQ